MLLVTFSIISGDMFPVGLLTLLCIHLTYANCDTVSAFSLEPTIHLLDI